MADVRGALRVDTNSLADRIDAFLAGISEQDLAAFVEAYDAFLDDGGNAVVVIRVIGWRIELEFTPEFVALCERFGVTP